MNGEKTFKKGEISNDSKKEYHRFNTTIHPAVITAAAIGRIGWINNLSHSQVSEMTKGLNEQVQYFRSRPLTGRYPVIWTDAFSIISKSFRSWSENTAPGGFRRE